MLRTVGPLTCSASQQPFSASSETVVVPAHPVALAAMDEEADYVVIGAGLAGLTAARALQRLGSKGTRARRTGRTLSSLSILARLFMPTTAAAAARLASFAPARPDDPRYLPRPYTPA